MKHDDESAPLFFSRKIFASVRQYLIEEEQIARIVKLKKIKSIEREVLDVHIREMTELRTGPGMFDGVYFEGGDVLRCYEGRFRFHLEDRDPIDIGQGESIVIYPDQLVTIEALEKTNLLLYTILNGEDVATYFDGLGFFDGLHGKTSTQRVLFDSIKSRHDGKGEDAMSLMNDALVSYGHEFRNNGNGLLIDAMCQIRKNLCQGSVRLQELCDSLKVSRSHLYRCFVAAGAGSVSENVKREQFRLALKLLRKTRLPVSEIAKKAGFLTATHFATFIKRRTGKAPRDLRR